MKNSYLYNKKLLEYCPNFDKIINADFYEDDQITKKIIKIYEDFIFSVDLNKPWREIHNRLLEISNICLL